MTFSNRIYASLAILQGEPVKNSVEDSAQDKSNNNGADNLAFELDGGDNGNVHFQRCVRVSRAYGTKILLQASVINENEKQNNQ